MFDYNMPVYYKRRNYCFLYILCLYRIFLHLNMSKSYKNSNNKNQTVNQIFIVFTVIASMTERVKYIRKSAIKIILNVYQFC